MHDRADFRLDGDRPWDMQVHREDAFARIFACGSRGMGESCMDGWWDGEQRDEPVCHVSRNTPKSQARPGDIIHAMHARLIRPGATKRPCAGARVTARTAGNCIAGCSTSA